MRVLALAAVVVAAAVAGCSGPSEAPPPADRIHARTVTLAPGSFAEVNVLLEAGDTLRWSWSVQGPAPFFNVHTHNEDNSARILRQTSDQTRNNGTFAAPEAGTYSLYWSNETPYPITLTYDVLGEGRLDPEHAPVP
jgi:hypothetical protein